MVSGKFSVIMQSKACANDSCWHKQLIIRKLCFGDLDLLYQIDKTYFENDKMDDGELQLVISIL
jgi:hypothetical protein